MVKRSRQPGTGGMAGLAIRSELAVVGVILLVAGITVAGSALENIVDMAAQASHIDMCAGQLEGEQVVVKTGWQPAICGVTGSAVCSVLAVVFIIFLVAGIAVCGRAGEDLIDMATLAGHTGVFADQLESGQVVIKGSGDPASGGVTGAAITAIASLVRVCGRVARGAVLWGGF